LTFSHSLQNVLMTEE